MAFRNMFIIATLFVLIAMKCRPVAGALHHPILFLSTKDLVNIRQGVATNRQATGKRLQDAVSTMLAKPNRYLPPTKPTAYGSRWNEVYGNNIAPLATYCILWPNDTAAMDLLRIFSDRMAAASPHWYVQTLPHDEVPVSHSLLGFATMFDLTYDLLDKSRQERYLEVICTHGRKLYNHAMQNTSWTHVFVHNHSPTILLSLHVAGLVCELHKVKIATQWRVLSALLFRRNMDVLRLVVDGSLNEGVTYGSYTSRSITQFAFLLNRRSKPANILENPWFAKHFDFLTYTILPGYQETVGIGDASPTWFYGPESQLHFLDRFVLNTGEANWLAGCIRENRAESGRLSQAGAHKWSTLHTELVWMNPSWGERPVHPRPRLHIFSDWGVAIYGGGVPQGHTFLSFKCGVYHGRAAHRLASESTLPFIEGWRSFNPGHEHPDQGSFVFYPRGKPFITEALYGPKIGHLNNILLFSPTLSAPHCTAPLRGQLGGDCGKWLNYRDPEVPRMKADIVTAVEDDGMVLILGDYAQSYSSHLGLAGVQRAVILLTPDVLLVVDTVKTKKISSLTHGHAFFHNNQHPFAISSNGKSATVNVDGEQHKLSWQASHEEAVSAAVGQATYKAEYGTRSTNFINCTFPISSHSPRHVAWLLTAPGVLTSEPVFFATRREGVSLRVEIESRKYDVHISNELSDLQSRTAWIGSPAFARVDINEQQHHLGIDVPQQCRLHVISPVASDGSHQSDINGDSLVFNKISIFLIITALLLAIGRLAHHKYPRQKAKKLTRVFSVIWLCSVLWLVLSHDFTKITKPAEVYRCEMTSGTSDARSVPGMFVTALPGSGVEILQDVLSTSDDIRNVSLKFLPPDSLEPLHLMFATGTSSMFSCGSPLTNQSLQFVKSWFDAIVHQPSTYFRYVGAPKHKRERLQKIADELDQKPGAFAAVSDGTGMWNSRCHLIARLLGDSSRIVLVLRDPRSWVAHQIRQMEKDADSGLGRCSYIEGLFREIELVEGVSPAAECTMPPEYELLMEEVKKGEAVICRTPHRFLALVWAVNTQLALGQGKSKVWIDRPEKSLYILPMEQLLEQPEAGLEAFFRWLRLPLRPVTTHRLLSLANAGVYHVQPYTSVLKSEWVGFWRNLPVAHVREIEDLTHDVLQRLHTFEGNVYLPSDS